MPVELTDDPTEGLEGPTARFEMYKQSDLVRDWRPRCLVIHGRRLYYYDNAQEAKPTEDKPLGSYKGWLDLTGAKVTSEDLNDGEVGYVVTVEEEYSIAGGREECSSGAYVLGVDDRKERDAFVRLLSYACRPRWLSDDYSVTCMESNAPFTFFDRRHHCRRCGGLFLIECMGERPLPSLSYASPVLVCVPCSEGTKRASRWLSKVPRSERSLKAKDPAAEAAASLLESTRQTLSAVGSLWKKLAEQGQEQTSQVQVNVKEETTESLGAN